MEITRKYPNSKFPPEILQKALDELKSILKEDPVKAEHKILIRGEERGYKIGEETIFFRDYESDFVWAVYRPKFSRGYLDVRAIRNISPPFSKVTVSLPEESQIGRVLKVFDDAAGTKYSSFIPSKKQDSEYVDLSRIDELCKVTSQQFDLKKLIRLCEELNERYASECFFSVAMLLRAILDHIPPIFGVSKFSEVANNYIATTKSFKGSMQKLENSSRNIADSHLHGQIRKKESLPNKTQVNFSNDLDVLLAEIVRILK